MRHSGLPQISRTLCLGGMVELEAGNGKKTIQPWLFLKSLYPFTASCSLSLTVSAIPSQPRTGSLFLKLLFPAAYQVILYTQALGAASETL